jgi:N-acetylmuramic acid 6-phosphate etherase
MVVEMCEKTEDINMYSSNITSMNPREIAGLIHAADIRAYESIFPNLNKIAMIAENMIETIKNHGRVIYIGAGTSGRIAIQDIAELRPTYGLGSESFDFIIAGGLKAVTESVENSEDIVDEAIKALKDKKITSKDMVVGITASGRTPFVLGGIDRSNKVGCFTVGITNNKNTEISKTVNICLELITGAEIIQGSTRMKAGTAQKMVLNMLSTITAVKLGRTLDNTMSNMGSWYNEKLKERAINIISIKFNMSREDSLKLLEKNDFNISQAIEELMADKKGF